MKPVTRSIIALVILISCSSWDSLVHRRINHVAVFTLPKAMARFNESNIDFITEHAIDTDKKRYVDSLEAPRHYLNIDHYGKRPFMKMPVKWDDAAKKYTFDTFAKVIGCPGQIHTLSFLAASSHLYPERFQQKSNLFYRSLIRTHQAICISCCLSSILYFSQ